MSINDFSETTILVIDDTPANLSVLSECLANAGYRVLLKKDGNSGFELARKRKPHLILLDIMMPSGIDGFETCQKLKSCEATQDIPVIFMSALSETLDKVRGYANGGVDYITKPFQLEEVLARVKNQIVLLYTERSLRRNRAILQSMLDVSFDGLAVVKIIYSEENEIAGYVWHEINDLAPAMFGTTSEKLFGKTLQETLPKPNLEKLSHLLSRSMSSNQLLDEEICLHNADGETWYHIKTIKSGDFCTISLHPVLAPKAHTKMDK